MQKHANNKLKLSLLVAFVTITPIILVCGCMQNTNKTVVMNAQQLYDDIIVENKENSYLFDYKSLEEGDTLIIRDVISNISYNKEYNATRVTFTYGKNQTYSPAFEGNLTGLLMVGDLVEIKVHIKHVKFEYNNKLYDLEVYSEQWVDEEYFKTHFAPFGGVKPLPAKCIRKV